MRYSLIPLVLGACAAVVVSLVPAGEATASGLHVRKHHHRASPHQRTYLGFNDHRAARAFVPVAAPSSRGSACPGNARAIDCTVWPPPFEDDPDRKATSSDGG